jgi:flavin reductase (DIM6/NTAB) family NADH-FMN oxidoreductase RutF
MIKTIDPKQTSTLEFYRWLTDAVIPRPIAFVSSCDKQGNVNLSPFSFFNVFSAKPPVLVFAPIRRIRDGAVKHTHENVLQYPEVVINLVSYSMVHQMSLASAEYERGVNEFKKSGFTQAASHLVKPPRVGEAMVSFECKVDKTIELGQEGGAGMLVICEVLLMHINEDILDVNGRPDALKMDLIARMGADWYNMFDERTMFQLPRPLSKLGIGIDALPSPIKGSVILNGNDLGRLATIEALPLMDKVNEYISNHPELQGKSTEQKHKMAKQLLDADKILEALYTLLSDR